MFKFLEERAQQLVTSLKPDLTALASENISLDDRTLSSSHIVVTYPPKQVLEEVVDGAILLPCNNAPVALYVHVPFCTGICTYCGFVKSAKNEWDPKIDAYLDLLDKESELYRNHFGDKKIPVRSIYIGGGTPTLLTVDKLKRLFSILMRDYDLVPGSEFSIEGSPETISIDKMAQVQSFGVNRVSIGIESFDNEILASIHRRHDDKMAKLAIEQIRKGGITNIDVDLMRGLPGYDTAKLITDLLAIQALDLPSVTSYQYVMKEKSIFFKKSVRAIEESQLHHAMFLLGMEEIGYQHAAPIIDCFTKDDSAVYQHNLQKWGHMGDLLSLGRGSYGNIGNVQYINFESDKSYSAAINAGSLPIGKAKALSADEMMHRNFVLGLKAGVNKKDFLSRHGVAPSASPLADVIKKLLRIGAIEENETAYKITLAGQLAGAGSVQNKFYSPSVASRCQAKH